MQSNLFYVIDKNVISKNIEKASLNMAINLNSVIDGRSNFYGLGNDIISIVEKAKINYVLVNDLKEALEIRKYNCSLEIIVKSLKKEYFDDAIVNDLIVTVYDYKELEEIKNLRLKDDIKVLLYIDNKDNIEGFKSINKIDIYQSENKHLNIIGAYTEVREDKKDEIFNEFLEITSILPKDSLRFILADKVYNTNVNYFGKNVYLKDKCNVISLCANIKTLKKFIKGDIFLNNKIKKEKNFAIIETPIKIDVKKVYIKNKLYKVYKSMDNYLVIEVDSKVKSKNQIVILGGNSRNAFDSNLLINSIPRYYLEGTLLEETKFL